MQCSEFLQNLNSSTADLITLNHECTVFCRYLVGQRPNDYVLRKYQDAHEIWHINWDHLHPVDTLLVKIARTSPLLTKVVDSYTVVFARDSLVRKKLLLLTAILETCAPTHYYFDSVDSSLKVILVLRMLFRGLLFILSLFLAGLLFLPLHVIMGIACKVFRAPGLWTES